jgi:AcrR family transcriptional regulator
MLDLYRRRWYDEITLADVAELAGVALQTVLNHFSTKEGLLSALLDDPRFLQEFAGERFRAKPGDARTALGYLVADYERAGDAMVRLLALEPRAPSIHPHLAMGRIGHRLWLESMFAGDLDDLGREDRERRLSMLICVTDVYAWKILRRDQGLTRDETLSRMLDMVAAVLHAGGRR